MLILTSCCLEFDQYSLLPSQSTAILLADSTPLTCPRALLVKLNHKVRDAFVALYSIVLDITIQHVFKPSNPQDMHSTSLVLESLSTNNITFKSEQGTSTHKVSIEKLFTGFFHSNFKSFTVLYDIYDIIFN
jgi:hypothetical protein